MLRNRLLYLAALVGGTVFYCFFYAWFSWFLLVLLWCLPALSLVVSLPAMLTMDLRLVSPGNPRRGEAAELRLQTVCRLPGQAPVPANGPGAPHQSLRRRDLRCGPRPGL